MPKSTEMRLKSDAYASNIVKRGKVKSSLRKDAVSAYPTGPILLGFLIFVVIGSGTWRPDWAASDHDPFLAIFQLFRAQLFW